mgnify:CR=1 FL=1
MPGHADTPAASPAGVSLRLRLGQLGDYARVGDLPGLVDLARRGLWSERRALGISKELRPSGGAQTPEAKFPVRTASTADIESILDPARGGDESADERWQRRLRRNVLATIGPEHCYVADLGGRGPSFMQYVFPEEDSELIEAELGDMGPWPAPGEAIVEYLYVPPDARSLPFLAGCMVQVAEAARARGITALITYTGVDEPGALMASQLAGYRAFSMCRTRFRLFQRETSCGPLPSDLSGVPIARRDPEGPGSARS